MRILKSSGALYAALLLPVFAIGLTAQQNGAYKADPGRGKEVFRVTACWRCHDVDKGESKRPPAPSLKGTYQRTSHTLVDGTRHEQHTDEMFREIISNGTKAMNPRGAVLTDEEMADLLAYLHTL